MAKATTRDPRARVCELLFRSGLTIRGQVTADGHRRERVQQVGAQNVSAPTANGVHVHGNEMWMRTAVFSQKGKES